MPKDIQLLRALASVRPGLPVQALRTIIGSRWREPSPHEEGRVRCIEHEFGFSAQIDIDGIVRRVIFGREWSDPAFPSDVDIDGLRCGMSISNACKVRPELKISRHVHPMPTSGVAKLDDHTRLVLSFLFDELRVVTFIDDRGIYPAKRSTPFPDAVEPAGAPFKDPNFKLVVLSHLVDRRLIDLGRPNELAEFVLKRRLDVDAEGHSLLRPVYDYVVRYPLTQEHLDAVETIAFDGGNSIYHYIWPFWDGESNEFDVARIEGIQLCRNVREFHAISMLNETDFSRLDQLPKLTTRSGVPEAP